MQYAPKSGIFAIRHSRAVFFKVHHSRGFLREYSLQQSFFVYTFFISPSRGEKLPKNLFFNQSNDFSWSISTLELKPLSVFL